MRLTRSSCVLIAAAAALLASTVPATAGTPQAKTVKAVVVKSWSNCSSGSVVWDTLNANWSSYGSIPISIDYSNASLCGESFTLAALEASHADVVILDDPAGVGKQFSAQEISDLQTYASEGHDLIGTYLVFTHGSQGVDNTALAPLFGLPQNDGWTGGDNSIDATYKLHKNMKQAKALFRGLPKQYASGGYNASQTPGDGTWDQADMAGAKLAGFNADRTAAITIYKEGDYNAVYIANMPEYNGVATDQQFLYNAIIYPSKG